VSKKLIIIVAAAGLVSFAGAFCFSWFTKSSGYPKSPEPGQQTAAEQQAAFQQPKSKVPMTDLLGEVDAKRKRAMTEKQLKDLIFEVRERIEEYDNKLEDLKLREQRIEVAQDTLKKDIKQLEDLRVELATTVASIKTERDKLLQSRIKIAQTERDNLMVIAATYDKMDSEAAGKILTNMSKAQQDSSNDAVKILHYMTDRTRAKLLAALATTEPKLAAYFCNKLKLITEVE